MVKKFDNKVDYWLDQIEQTSEVDVAMKLAHCDENNTQAIKLALEKRHEKQRDKDQKELKELAKNTLDAQEKGNNTQTKIWWTLLATIVVMVGIAIFKK